MQGAVLVGVAVSLLSASPLPRDQAAIIGFWTLNSELTRNHDQAGSSNDRARTAHRQGDAVGSALRTDEYVPSMVREIFEADAHITIAPAGEDALTIVDGIGSARVYRTSGEIDWQEQRSEGWSCRTVWQGSALVQEMWFDGGAIVVRMLESSTDEERLTETLVFRLPGVRDTTVVRVYDSDRIR